MKKIVFTLIFLMMVSQVVFAKGYEATKQAGDLKVRVMLDKNPPTTGDSELTIAIKDAAGKAVTDAKLLIDYGMPAMPGMPAMNYKSGTSLKDKRYAANLNFSMSGSWAVTVKITRAGKTQTVKLNVDIK